ncbi:MAG: MarR family transcriptional regulator [Eubacterium sp.]|nr:MarR family transcriptional regulator [Eubacterium sp.]
MEHLGHKIKMIDHLFKLRMDKNLEQLDVTFAQMHVLIYLFRNSGVKITQKQLAEHLCVKHSTMSGILKRLQEKELIEIKVDEENKKYRNINTTKKAAQLNEQMRAHRDETEALFIQGFSDIELKQLVCYLDRLYNNLLLNSALSDKEIKCFNKEMKQ